MVKVVVLTDVDGEHCREPYYYFIDEDKLDISKLSSGDIVVYPREIKRVNDVTTRNFELHDPITTADVRKGLCGFRHSDSDDDNEEF